MPPVVSRPSQNAEAARAAALQAEFNEKKWVWVPDEREGYVAGWVIREEDEVGEVVMASGGETRHVSLNALSKMNPPKFDRVDDIADLTYLNEASVVHNLRLRYLSGAIYTYSGLFLVAINPYTQLPLYTDAIIEQYRNKRRDENAPHIFAVAERAWVSMNEERENQSVLITGESGAGKTENTKKVIQYLAAIATDNNTQASPTHSPTTSSFGIAQPPTGLPRGTSFKHKSTPSTASANASVIKGTLGLLEQQILQANPILEAFGNAQTARNNNSSRFGKFVRISFAPDGSIAGANIDWYLLEKSRVVVRPEVERNFHVFYQLLEAGGSMKDELLLEGGVAQYEYLNKSRREVDGINDREEWKALKNSLAVVGFNPAEQFDLFRIVAAILHIGNIEISADRHGEQAGFKAPAQVEKACHLLGVPVQEFTKAVLRPKVLAGREWVTQARTKQQALEELMALCKTLYEKSFGALVDRINKALDRPSSKSTFIGVLDIAGFEIFEINSFEQLCINYTNERLQQFFNHHMFVLEQEEYRRESIEWEFVNFGLDLQPTIDLIESTGNTIGILSCLDEECIMPKATEATFTHKLNVLWASETPAGETPHLGKSKYAPARFSQGFTVQHYAGKVEYRTDGWLEKNKDPLNDNLTRVLSASSERYVAGLFAEYSETGGVLGGAKKRILKKGAFRTVGQRHKEQLNNLMTQLQATQPHFVRCIVPNPNKRPGKVDVPLVLDQLRCNGVLEGIRIARLGYPNRLPFGEFRYRYEILTPSIIPRGYMDGRKACLRMVNALDLDSATFRIGTSKIFFKAGVLAELEERRDGLLFDIFSRLQAVARKWTARRQMKKILHRAVAIRTIQRNARVYGELKEWGWWQLYTKVRPLLAATRNDDELRKKNVELELIKERAERDKREKQALEDLKMQLEQEKRKVEEQLEAERAFALEKDALLERSKRQEGELEEEILAMQADLEAVDGQLERALAGHKAMEENFRVAKMNFEEASQHLQRLEGAEREWKVKEVELCEALRKATMELEDLAHAKDDLGKTEDDLRRSLKEKEEDISRVRERLQSTVGDLEAKLSQAVKARELSKRRAEALEEEARRAKDQLAELSRTATDYSGMVQKKEAEIASLVAELTTVKRERDSSVKQAIELQGQIDTVAKELTAIKGDRERDVQARRKLQEELDELRKLMAAKTSEETKRSEVERSKEHELAALRSQVSKMQDELSEVRRHGLETQNKLKVELEAAQRERAELGVAHGALLEKEKTASAKHQQLDASLSDAVRSKRVLESELQAVRTRQVDMENQLADAIRSKEILERQLVSAQAKHQDYEDAVLHVEREKGAWVRQMESVKIQLEQEITRRIHAEQSASQNTTEFARLKDRVIKFERDLAKAQSDLQSRDWEIKQLKANQNKTIVEHVHVLQEAKKRTDIQLAETQQELLKEQARVKSLEKTKSRLMGEAEDAARQTEKELVAFRSKEKNVKSYEEKATKAIADAERERKLREATELQTRRLQTELRDTQNHLTEMEQQLKTAQRTKDTLAAELSSLATESDGANALAKMRRQYEARISQLESKVDGAEVAQMTAERIKQKVDQQHAELRRLISSSGPRDDFRERLLKELQQADDAMEREYSRKASKVPEIRTFANVSPTKRQSVEGNGPSRVRRDSQPAEPSRPDAQTAQLQHQVQALELRIVASDRVRQHLEASLRELTVDLENSDGSKQSLDKHRSKVARENNRLAELLNDEAEARRVSEASQMDGIKTMWQKFQTTIETERESYGRLEETRKALLVQQRALQAEVENQKRQMQELNQIKRQLLAEVADLKDHVELEQKGKSEEAAARRRLQAQLQELEISSTASGTMQGDLQQALGAYKAKSETYLSKLEAAEIARAKAVHQEGFARRALADAKRAQEEADSGRKFAEEEVAQTRQQIADLESRLEDENREITDVELLRRRLTEELEDERDSHQKELAERDFKLEQTRQKYQAELLQVTEESRYLRDSISNLRSENHKMRSELDELQLRYDDELYAGESWKKEKGRLTNKITDLQSAYDASKAAQSDQQNQIVSLLSQVRELRAVLDEAEAERAALRQARSQLETRLNDIAQAHLDANRMSSDRVLQELHLEKQDLRSRLEEQADRVVLAYDKLKKTEAFANECQIELSKVRNDNSDLERENGRLQKDLKDTQVRLVELEAKAMGVNAPRPNTSRRVEGRIAELTNQLNQASNDKAESSRMHRAADKTARDVKLDLQESERFRQRLEQQVGQLEGKITDLRTQCHQLGQSEAELKGAKRRAELEVQEYKSKLLSTQRELESLRNRFERPASVMYSSPAHSPRK